MNELLKNRIALSTVVTTLIILVISVLLASVVCYYAINVVSTRVQEESLTLSKQHLWHNATATVGSPSYGLAAIMVINTGGRDVVIDKITVRGQDCPWNQTATQNQEFVVYCATTNAISQDLYYVSNFNFTASKAAPDVVTIDGVNYNFTTANNELVLKSGYTLLAYVINPDSISVNDVGLTVSITLYTAQAMYYRETNVQAVDNS